MGLFPELKRNEIMYASMNTENLVNEAIKQPVGSLTFELVDAINGDMDLLTIENERLETEAEESTNAVIDNCEEMVFRIEQVEDRINDILDSEDCDMDSARYTLKDTMALLNDAVVYFNNQQKVFGL